MALKAKYGPDFNFDVLEAFNRKRDKILKNPKFIWGKLATQTIESNQVL